MLKIIERLYTKLIIGCLFDISILAHEEENESETVLLDEGRYILC